MKVPKGYDRFIWTGWGRHFNSKEDDSKDTEKRKLSKEKRNAESVRGK